MAFLVLLAGCGGGGGGDTEGSDASTGQAMADPAPIPGAVDPVIESDEQTEAGEQAEPDGRTEPGEPAEPDGSTQQLGDPSAGGDVGTVSDNPTAATARSDDLISVAVIGEDAPGLPGQPMTSIQLVDFDSRGRIAFIGSYGADRSPSTGVFAGTYSDVALVLDENTIYDNIGSDLTPGRLLGVKTASDGSVAARLELDSPAPPDLFSLGGEARDALVVVKDGQARVLVTQGDQLPGTDGPREVGEILITDHSAAGSLFFTESALRGRRALFLVSDSGTDIVAEQRYVSEGAAVMLESCSLYLNTFNSIPPAVLDNGDVIFEGVVFGSGSAGDCDATARVLARRSGDAYQSIVRQGDAVPNAPGWVFGTPTPRQVSDNGDVLVRVELFFPSSVIAERREWLSWWVFTAQGDANLVLLEGEQLARSDGDYSLEVGGLSNGGISGLVQPRLRINSAGAAVLRLEDRGRAAAERNSVHTGPIAIGQPHGSLEAPGASSLALVAESYVAPSLPGTALDGIAGPDTRLRDIGVPAIDDAGRVYFVATALNADSLASVGTWILRSDAPGQLSAHIGPTERVEVAGVDELALSGVLSARFGVDPGSGSPTLNAFADGTLLLSRGALDSRTVGAIVTVAAARHQRTGP